MKNGGCAVEKATRCLMNDSMKINSGFVVLIGGNDL